MDRFQVLGDIFAAQTVAAGRSPHEDSVLISQRNRQTVHFMLADHAELRHAQQFQGAGMPGI